MPGRTMARPPGTAAPLAGGWLRSRLAPAASFVAGSELRGAPAVRRGRPEGAPWPARQRPWSDLGRGHPLGTDDVGYDVLGRLMLGGQVSLEVGIGAAVLSSIVGAAWGAAACFAGGALDSVPMRLVDSVYAIPPILLVLPMGSKFVPRTWMLIMVISVVSWVPTATLSYLGLGPPPP